MCQSSVPAKPPLSEAVRRAEKQRLRRLLREQGYAVTARRMAIYDVFLETNDHICAEHVLEAVHGMHPEWHMNKTTVYRTLDLLQSLGLIYEMRHDDGRAQYELALYGPHGHLICNVCGQVWDLDSRIAAALHQELRTKQGFIVDVENHALQGLCARCATA